MACSLGKVCLINKKKYVLRILAVMVVTSAAFVYHNYTPFDVREFETPVNSHISGSLFTYTLSKTADENKNVILAFIDYGYLDMGINLYLSSIKPLGLKNHIFMGSDAEVCPAFIKVVPEVNCVQVTKDHDSKAANAFASRAFIRKNWRKLKVVYDVLQLGFNVLLLDLDIVMFKNPFVYFDKCPTCDIQIQSDHIYLCGGFYYAKSRNNSQELFRRSWAVLYDFITGKRRMRGGDFNEQILLSNTIGKMNKSVSGFKHVVLPEKEFGNGNSYFMAQKLMFGTDGPSPPDVYIVHNNWIVYESSKTYRFKENFMWFYDKDGYYSDTSRKYIQYENLLDSDQVGTDAVHELERETLQAALSVGFLLNRTVILPSFTCEGCLPSNNCNKPKLGRCALNAHFKVPVFDRNFKDLYREHTFLKNSMVPDIVKASVSKTIVIESDFHKKYKQYYQLNNLISQSVDVYKPQDPSMGASDAELVEWFSKYKDVSVVNLHTLYKSVKKLPNVSKYSDFNWRLKRGVILKVGNYMQGGNA